MMSTMSPRRSLPTNAELLALDGLKAAVEIVPNSRTPKKGSAWRATCEWQGRRFEAVSRNGASHALCRELVAAGVPDKPLQVFDQDGKLRFVIRSIHEAAGRTYLETSNEPMRRVRHKARPAIAGEPIAAISAVELRGVLVEGSEPAAVRDATGNFDEAA
jgi:hypothetical protein